MPLSLKTRIHPAILLSLLAAGLAAASEGAELATIPNSDPLVMLVEVSNPLDVRKTPLGFWKQGRLELLEAFRNRYGGICPAHLAEPSQCGGYMFGDYTFGRGTVSPRVEDVVHPTLKGAPVTVNGTRVGTFDGTLVPNDTRKARPADTRPDPIGRIAADGALEYSVAIASHLPVVAPSGWRQVNLTEEDLAALETRSRVWLALHRPPGSRKLGPLHQLFATAFESGSRRIEFVAVGFEVDWEEGASGFAASLAWGLVEPDTPFIFYGPQLIGDAHFHYLAQAADIGNDGSIELILYHTDNHTSTWDIWQQQPNGSYKQIAAVSRY